MDWTEKNGCGIKMGWLGVVRPPHHKFFETECVIHDEMYNLGGSESERKKADKRLFNEMVKHIVIHFKDKASSLWWFVTLAYLYYALVRLFGKKHFNYNTLPDKQETNLHLCGDRVAGLYTRLVVLQLQTMERLPGNNITKNYTLRQ